jgi:hypothetical protein
MISFLSLPLFNRTSFDSDGNSFACGNGQGIIQVGDLFTFPNDKKFSVTSDSIHFVSYSRDANSIFFSSVSSYGYIDSASKTINTTSFKSLKIQSTFQGGFLVQKHPNAIRVFVGSKEIPMAFHDDIICFAFNDLEWGSVSGSFCLGFSNFSLSFFHYNVGEDFSQTDRRCQFQEQVNEISCIAW